MKFKYCCQDFENHTKDFSKDGFYFLAKNYDDLSYFVIQTRLELKSKKRIIQTGIKYCPYCGKQLRKLIKKQNDLFLELASIHKEIILD